VAIWSGETSSVRRGVGVSVLRAYEPGSGADVELDVTTRDPLLTGFDFGQFLCGAVEEPVTLGD